MSQEEKYQKYYYLAFSAFEEGIGPLRFRKILEKFKNAKAGWTASEKELNEILPSNIVQKFLHFRSMFDLERYILMLSKKNISFLTWEDSSYPYLLKQISDPPPVLYIAGDWKENEWWTTDHKIAVVGSRIPTSYGCEMTEILTRDLVEHGLVVVSGLANGIDTIVHKTAIENKGKTIAVLGCGVDIVYPSKNKSLYEKIVDGNGCVISEMPLSHFASRATFPARNRIISGLSKGVLMTEGAVDSGALITCSYAGEQGRDVFAVPGMVTSKLSAGTLGLLKKGAKLVLGVEDILEELGIGKQSHHTFSSYKNNIDNKDLSIKEKTILALVLAEELTIDDIIRKSALPAREVCSYLSLLELKGYIKGYSGKYKYESDRCRIAD